MSYMPKAYKSGHASLFDAESSSSLQNGSAAAAGGKEIPPLMTDNSMDDDSSSTRRRDEQYPNSQERRTGRHHAHRLGDRPRKIRRSASCDSTRDLKDGSNKSSSKDKKGMRRSASRSLSPLPYQVLNRVAAGGIGKHNRYMPDGGSRTGGTSATTTTGKALAKDRPSPISRRAASGGSVPSSASSSSSPHRGGTQKSPSPTKSSNHRGTRERLGSGNHMLKIPRQDSDSNLIKAVMAPTLAAGNFLEMTASAVVDGSKALAGGVVDGSKAIAGGVVDGSKAIAGGVVGGSKAVVGGSKAIVGGSKAIVVGSMKGIRNATGLSSSQRRGAKSKWEEGIEVIDSILQPGGLVYQAMTPEQRKQLAGVKKLLLKAPRAASKSSTTQHIPRELLEIEVQSIRRRSMAMSELRTQKGGSSNGLNLSGSTVHSNFILQEYAGIKDATGIVDDFADDSIDSADGFGTVSMDQATASTADVTTVDDDILSSSFSNDDTETITNIHEEESSMVPVVIPKTLHHVEAKRFVPPEFTKLDPKAKLKVYNMLTWDSIQKWDFDVFELNKVTNGNPMLFLGWAILGSPYSQHAMASCLGLVGNIKTTEDIAAMPGYNFMEELNIPPDKLCNLLTAIENDYTKTNPYHNNIHGADVTQSLHALIQVSKEEDFMKDCPRINLFSILLAAVCHDVCHPGTTNSFHTKLHNEVAVLYNDNSVLENWHVAHAFSRMLGLDLKAQDLFTKKQTQNIPTENNILCNATTDQFNTVRKLMIEAILHTDMTKHFQMVNSVRGMLIEQQEGTIKKEDLTWQTLTYMLHMADISGQAKEEFLSKQWTQRCMDEFFKQGDIESSLGMPISANCDRSSVKVAESQIGFIRFVVEPAYEVLGCYVSYVQHDVLPIIQDNLIRYLEMKEEQDEQKKQQQEQEQQEEQNKKKEQREQDISKSTTKQPRKLRMGSSIEC